MICDISPAVQRASAFYRRKETAILKLILRNEENSQKV